MFHSKTEINYLLSADDIVLIAENRLYLQKLLNKTQKYVDVNNLQINEDKTKIIIFKKGGYRKTLMETFNINHENLQVVKNYKWVKFHTTGKFQITAKEIVIKSKQKIDAMWSTLWKAKLPELQNYLQYFDSVILPITTYAAQIWALEYSDILEMTQTHFIRKLLLIFPPRAANYFLRLEMGRQHLQYQILFLTIKYHFKLFKMQNKRLPKIILNELSLHRGMVNSGQPKKLVKHVQHYKINLAPH